MSSAVVGVIAGLIFLGASALVFVFGSSYFSLFRTNKSWWFKLALVAGAAVLSWVLLRSSLNLAYGHLAFAFLAAAAASLFGAAAGQWLHRPLKLKDDTLQGMALGKALEALVVVGAILALMAAFRIPFASAYLTIGKLGLGLGIGCVGFLLFTLAAWQQGRQLKIQAATVRRLLPWILLFVFANAFMEELWFRAIFLGPMTALVGPIAAIVLTAAVFALAHVGASYLSKEARIRFLVILFPLGLAWAACLHFTGSIIASTIFHAGADLMVINGFIAALYGPKPASPEA